MYYRVVGLMKGGSPIAESCSTHGTARDCGNLAESPIGKLPDLRRIGLIIGSRLQGLPVPRLISLIIHPLHAFDLAESAFSFNPKVLPVYTGPGV